MRKKQLIFRALFLVTGSVIALSSCQKEEKIEIDEIKNEFITTVKLKLVSGTDTLTAIWKDLTPSDANPPDTSLARLTLKTNTTYTGEVELLDETANPVFDVTEKIKERANIHLFGYLPDANLTPALNVSITDFDTNTPALPVGLTFNLSTNTTTTNGIMRVVLKHQPNLKNGTLNPGSIDVDVNFRVQVIN